MIILYLNPYQAPDLPEVQPRVGASPSPTESRSARKPLASTRSSLIGDIQIPGAGGNADEVEIFFLISFVFLKNPYRRMRKYFEL